MPPCIPGKYVQKAFGEIVAHPHASHPAQHGEDL